MILSYGDARKQNLAQAIEWVRAIESGQTATR